MIRVICLCAGLCGAAAASQFPAFTQAYTQRLAGQVDALTVVVKDFDASAMAAGLGRQEALEQMTGTPFLTARRGDMQRTFARHATLSVTLADLRSASPLARIGMPLAFADRDIAASAWGDFEPALPLSTAGAVSGGIGFVAGWAALGTLLSLVRLPFRRRRSRPVPTRGDPPVARPVPTLVSPRQPGPRLPGERRVS